MKYIITIFVIQLKPAQYAHHFLNIILIGKSNGRLYEILYEKRRRTNAQVAVVIESSDDSDNEV